MSPFGAIYYKFMDILEKIVAAKKKEIEPLKLKSPVERFERDGFFWQISNRSLVQSLLKRMAPGSLQNLKEKAQAKDGLNQKNLK